MNRTKYLTHYWLPVIFYCTAIFIQSSLPSSSVVPDFNYADKLLHCLGYALLGILFFRAYKTLPIGNNIYLLIAISILSSSLYGLSDEFHQSFVPSRSADITDVVADAIGSVAGVVGYSIAWKTS